MDKPLERGAGLRSEKRNVCVMFLDIRDFTSFAEHGHPEEVVEYLEPLSGFMIDIVNRHHGIINKFLGDVVNLAARIEQLNKQVGSQLLV